MIPDSTSPLPTITQIEEDLEFFDDWEDRYRYLIDLGKQLPSMPEAEKIPANIVHGCTSQVWLTATPASGPGQELATDADDPNCQQLQLRMDSDALIVRGLLALVAAAYSNKNIAQISNYDIDGLFERLDLLSHLSMTRGNGLRAMVKRIQTLAFGLAGKS